MAVVDAHEIYLDEWLKEKINELKYEMDIQFVLYKYFPQYLSKYSGLLCSLYKFFFFAISVKI